MCEASKQLVIFLQQENRLRHLPCESVNVETFICEIPRNVRKIILKYSFYSYCKESIQFWLHNKQEIKELLEDFGCPYVHLFD
jgi:hypothetical protein